MNTQELEKIAEESASQLKVLITECEEEIIEAIKETLIQSQAKDEDSGGTSTVKFNIAHKLCINLSSRTQTDSISFSVAHKAELTKEIDDPQQPKLL